MLTDLKIRSAKVEHRAYKISDSHGLYLEVRPTGAKLWRYRYKLNGRENTFAIGEYPLVTLQDARRARDEARELVRQGMHPAHVRTAKKRAIIREHENTFQVIAEEWIERKRGGWSPYYNQQVLRSLAADVFPYIGNRPIRTITPHDMLTILDRITGRGAETVAINVRQWCSAIFCYAVSTLRAETDPVASLRAAIIRPPVRNAQAMSRDDLRVFMHKLDKYGGLRTTQLAIKLLLYTFVRTIEMRRATWDEIKEDDALWIIPADKMKMRRTHMVPLSKQALNILDDLHFITGNGEYLFPNSRRPHDMMSATTVNRAMEYLGIPISGHDFRATASTHLHELGFEGHLVEMQLAHAERNKAKAAYNHAQYLQERRQMMQFWADWLDELNSQESKN